MFYEGVFRLFHFARKEFLRDSKLPILIRREQRTQEYHPIEMLLERIDQVSATDQSSFESKSTCALLSLLAQRIFSTPVRLSAIVSLPNRNRGLLDGRNRHRQCRIQKYFRRFRCYLKEYPGHGPEQLLL